MDRVHSGEPCLWQSHFLQESEDQWTEYTQGSLACERESLLTRVRGTNGQSTLRGALLVAESHFLQESEGPIDRVHSGEPCLWQSNFSQASEGPMDRVHSGEPCLCKRVTSYKSQRTNGQSTLRRALLVQESHFLQASEGPMDRVHSGEPCLWQSHFLQESEGPMDRVHSGEPCLCKRVTSYKSQRDQWTEYTQASLACARESLLTSVRGTNGQSTLRRAFLVQESHFLQEPEGPMDRVHPGEPCCGRDYFSQESKDQSVEYTQGRNQRDQSVEYTQRSLACGRESLLTIVWGTNGRSTLKGALLVAESHCPKESEGPIGRVHSGEPRLWQRVTSSHSVQWTECTRGSLAYDGMGNWRRVDSGWQGGVTPRGREGWREL
ncbi:hypothetical protein NDU88_002006 [Pleurodeles waltl]|uniref:Uncharacterized protein n=1 Tax=Pleurodeles waltl TaxID=8319 RepID=A0AAV7QBG1_PLEWA|nr:hypothetical protein NDU88_002006 [Pleurodeles waltl]